MNELKPGEMRWVSCAERMPKLMGEYYYVRREDGAPDRPDELVTLYLKPEGWSYPDGDKTKPRYTATHWLEVNPPEVPKKTVRKEVEAMRVFRYDTSSNLVALSSGGIPPDATNIKVSYEVRE